jgi:MFS family permease
MMLGGFAIQGFLLSAILLQIMPILTGLDLGAAAVLITTAFGPAQVMSRLVNMVFGKTLRQTTLAVIAAAFLPAGLIVLVLSAPAVAGALAFAVLFGLGSGLASIVSGSLPLYLLGRERYGTYVGWMSSARQIASAIAPFLLAVAMGSVGLSGALWLCIMLGLLSIAIFLLLWALPRQGPELSASKA